MSECIICAANLRTDIDKMISSGANNRHIKEWAKERELNLSLKAIQAHKIEHLQYIEEGRRQEAEGRRSDCPKGLASRRRGIPTRQQSNQGFSRRCAKTKFCGGQSPKCSDGNRAAKPTTKPSALCPLPPALLAKRDQIEVNRDGTYDAIEIMKHQLAQLSEEVNKLKEGLEEIAPQSQKKAIANLKQEKLTAQTRLLTAVANLKEVKLKQAVGELVANQELEEKWSYSLVGFKAKLEAIPNKVALELSPITNKSNVQNILTKLISEALEELDNGSRQAV